MKQINTEKQDFDKNKPLPYGNTRKRVRGQVSDKVFLRICWQVRGQVYWQVFKQAENETK